MDGVKIISLLGLLFLGFCIKVHAQSAQGENAIRKALEVQEKAWNRGDVHTFMEGYWKSEKLKFIGKNGVTYGWNATLQRYMKKYPDREAMGHLTFELLHLEELADGVVMVVGKWHLQRTNDAPEGHFSLIWKKIDGQWKIITDHTS